MALTESDYKAWRERRINNLPNFEQWKAKQKAKYTPARIARAEARFKARQEMQAREYAERLAKLAGLQS